MPSDILAEIFANTRLEVAARKRIIPLAQVRRAAEQSGRPIDFVQSIRRSALSPALIAEVKFHSPSRGELARDPDPQKLAHPYARNGAAAISVLTDEKYFHGRLEYLVAIHAALPEMPLLRKDFIFDPYQVYETRAAGASAVLLIVAALEPALLARLHGLALSLELAPLVEVHNRQELEVTLRVPQVRLIGVNNRDLHSFKVDLQTCLELRPLVPKEVCFVAESGIQSSEDMARLEKAGVDAVLIGEALVTAPDVSNKVRDLFGLAESMEEAL